MTDFTKVPVGTTVYSLTRGEGKISKISEGGKIYPVLVSTSDGCLDSYTKDGKFLDRDVAPTLYLNRPKVVEEITIEVDTPVWVRMKDRNWVPRHAAGKFNSDGMIMCWTLGQTSHTTDSEAQWDEYSLTDPNAAD